MKRPGVSEKQAADPDHEPDLYKISEVHPVPEKADDESILLQCTLQGGPKARMPIYSGSSSSMPTPKPTGSMPDSTTTGPKLTPSDQHALAAFQQSLGASENQLTGGAAAMTAANPTAPVVLPQSNFLTPMPFNLPFNMGSMNNMGDKSAGPLAVANQLAFANPNMAAAYQASSAASQFAAGFAAATALSHQQFQSMLAQMQGGTAPDQPTPPPQLPQPAQLPQPPQQQQQPPPQHTQDDTTPIPLQSLNNPSPGDIF